MKTLSTGFLASQSICVCLLVQRGDGVMEAFTSSDQNVTIPSPTLIAGFDVGARAYLAKTGLDVSNLVSQSALAVDNMDLTVLPDEVTYPQADILAGRWDSAKFWLFEADYISPGIGINPLKRGTTGEYDGSRTSIKFEFRGLKQALQQAIGEVTSKTCRYELGSIAKPFGLCRVNLTPWTHSYAITTVTSSHVIAASAALEVADYYGEGTATATSGPNAGFSQKVKSFAAGVFTLALPMPYPVQVGDTFTFVAGCRKRCYEDCKPKFNNILNFGGEPHVPGTDLLTADPDAPT